MRSFIRHPSDIPIEIKPVASPEGSAEVLINISYGGLCFNSQAPLLPGAIVSLHIELGCNKTDVRARVSWCREKDTGYDMGVEFLDASDSYAVRMVEQVCYIEHYRREVLVNEGRTLSSEEAALEWISENAADFLNPD